MWSCLDNSQLCNSFKAITKKNIYVAIIKFNASAYIKIRKYYN